MSILFFGQVTLQDGVQSDPQKIKALMDMPAPNNIEGAADFHKYH